MPPYALHHQTPINVVNNTTLDEPYYDKKWATMFPQSVSDISNSQRFMVRAIFVTFSSILRYRKVLPETCFRSNHITEKVKVKSLDMSDPLGNRAASKLRAAGDAIKAGYLDELSLVLYENENDEEEAMEVYTWKMFYDDGLPYAEISSGDGTRSPFSKLAALKYMGTHKTRDQLLILLRSVHFMCSKILNPLPKGFHANFRIKYREHAPDNYSSDGFHETNFYYRLSQDAQRVTVGNMRAGFHGNVITCAGNYISDSFEAELKMKDAADAFANSIGADNDILFQSFTSNTHETSIIREKSPRTPPVEHVRGEPAIPTRAELIQTPARIEEQILTETLPKGKRGRPKRTTKTVAEKKQDEKEKKHAEKETLPMKARRYSKIRSSTSPY